MESRDPLAASLAGSERRLYSYFRRMGADGEDARDLTQETFVRAIRGSMGYRGDAPFELWLIGIARNVWRTWASKREPRAPTHRDEPEPGSDHVDVQRVLQQLEPAEREILTLRFTLDLSGEQTARVLGISSDAVRQRVARAKEAFRRVWEGS